jgi:hypothetical protein
MGGKKTRKRFRVQELPEELREAINKKIVEGATYDQVKTWIDEMATAGGDACATVSRSAIARYGKDFITRLERVKQVSEQAKAILSETEGPGLELEEATSKLFSQMLMETLLDMQDLSGGKIADLLLAFGKIQASSVSRERLKQDFRKKAEKAVQRIEKAAQKELSPETMKRIREEVYGIV